MHSTKKINEEKNLFNYVSYYRTYDSDSLINKQWWFCWIVMGGHCFLSLEFLSIGSENGMFINYLKWYFRDKLYKNN